MFTPTERNFSFEFPSESKTEIVFTSESHGNETRQPLADFCLWIKEESLVQNEFGEIERKFTIAGKFADGEIIAPFIINAKDFASLDWLDAMLGAKAIVHKRSTMKQYLVQAIQELSQSKGVAVTRYYSYSGWHDKKYLFPNGEQSSVELEQREYQWTNETNDFSQALKFLEIAEPRITFPLWAAMHAAVLNPFLRCDFALWLYGETGTLKSTIVRHAMNHFGRFEKITTSWNATANYLEKQLSIIGDAPFVIDDYAPQQDSAQQTALDRTVERIIRNIGNQSARGRLKQNLQNQKFFEPRALLISTGEQLPSSKSIIARIYSIRVQSGDIDRARISEMVQYEPCYNKAMQEFVRHVEENYDAIAERCKELMQIAFSDPRVFAASVLHERQRSALVKLYVATTIAAEFYIKIKMIKEDEVMDMLDKCMDALLANMKQHSEELAAEDPADTYLSIIKTLVESRRIFIAEKKTDFDNNPDEIMHGFHDDESLYLIPDRIHDAAMKYCREVGRHFPLKQKEIHRLLFEKVGRKKDKDCVTTTARYASQVYRVLALSINRIESCYPHAVPVRFYGSGGGSKINDNGPF